MIETPRGLNAVVIPEIHAIILLVLSFGLLTMFLIWFWFCLEIPWIWSYFINVNIVITLNMVMISMFRQTSHSYPEIVLHFYLDRRNSYGLDSRGLFRHKITKKTFQMAFWVVFLFK